MKYFQKIPERTRLVDPRNKNSSPVIKNDKKREKMSLDAFFELFGGFGLEN